MQTVARAVETDLAGRHDIVPTTAEKQHQRS